MSTYRSIPFLLAAIPAMASVDATVAVKPDSGSGGHRIETLANLRWLSENSSSWSDTFVQIADIDASVTSSWNSGADFSPIGNATTAFKGSYHGRGHAISGLHIVRPSDTYAGLFGVLGTGAVVDSLELDSFSVTGGRYVGAAVANITGGSIVGVHAFDVGVSSLDSTTDVSIGGLVGYNSGAVRGCSASGRSILLRHTGHFQYIGGLVGSNSGAIDSSSATIDTMASVNTRTTPIGGLVGLFSKGRIVSCAAEARIHSPYSAGGLVGIQNGGSVVGSHATGSVAAATLTGDYAYAGGLIGTSIGDSVADCWASASVRSTTYGGGLVGLMGNIRVVSCRASGVVACSSSTPTFAGGIAGMSSGVVNSCSASGSVQGQLAGGLVGLNDSAVTSSRASGSVSGSNYAGGLLGGKRIGDDKLRHGKRLGPGVRGRPRRHRVLRPDRE